MSWLITFASLSILFLVGFLGVAFIEGIFEWDNYSTKTWRAYFSLIVSCILFVLLVWLLHYGIQTRHLFGC